MSEVVRRLAAVFGAAQPELQRLKAEYDARVLQDVQTDAAAFAADYRAELKKAELSLSSIRANESSGHADAFVSSEELAAFAGVTARCIRNGLRDCEYKIDGGRKLYHYKSALPILHNWCKTNRRKQLKTLEWPNLPENLKKQRPPRKKK